MSQSLFLLDTGKPDRSQGSPYRQYQEQRILSASRGNPEVLIWYENTIAACEACDCEGARYGLAHLVAALDRSAGPVADELGHRYKECLALLDDIDPLGAAQALRTLQPGCVSVRCWSD